MSRSLKNIAFIVTCGTLLSKCGGLVRQLVIASAFGVGAAYDAYNYAYILPGFLLVLLGGINGPFHNAMVSVLAKRPQNERSHVLAAVNTIISFGLLIVMIFLITSADSLIRILGPGLTPEIHKIATIQLQIMAPIALISGLLGLGFGSLNAANKFWFSSISPLISSISIITGVSLLWMQAGTKIGSIELSLKAGIVLAISTLVGALLQWLIQLPILIKSGLAKIKLVWDWHHPGVKEVLKVMAPATLSSGMLQINVFTDLFFASNIVGAAAGLSYASLLVQTPLGLISNALLVPLLPTFSKLADPKDKPALISRIHQGLILSTLSMVSLGAIFIALSRPIVALVFERGAFDSYAAGLVAALLIAYGLGMPAYLGRDLLVRVFYAISDGKTPFRLSLLGILLNIIFDWLFIGGPTPWGNQIPFNLGAPGLVISTAFVNLLTCLALIKQLHSKLNGLPIRLLIFDLFKILIAGFHCGLITWLTYHVINIPIGLGGEVLEIGLSASLGLGVFVLISKFFGIKEISQILALVNKKIIHP